MYVSNLDLVTMSFFQDFFWKSMEFEDAGFHAINVILYGGEPL
jgi:hypothetical protein